MCQRCADSYRWVCLGHWSQAVCVIYRQENNNACVSIAESLCTSKKNQDRCLELIAECIFLEKKAELAKKSNSAGLTVFQEFQLVLVFAQYFSRPGPDVTRNAVFLCLFGNTSLPPARSRVLSKFISTAISDSIAPVGICHMKSVHS